MDLNYNNVTSSCSLESLSSGTGVRLSSSVSLLFFLFFVLLPALFSLSKAFPIPGKPPLFF